MSDPYLDHLRRNMRPPPVCLVWEPFSRTRTGGALVLYSLPNHPAVLQVAQPDKVQLWRGGGKRADRKLRRDLRKRSFRQEPLSLAAAEAWIRNPPRGESPFRPYDSCPPET